MGYQQLALDASIISMTEVIIIRSTSMTLSGKVSSFQLSRQSSTLVNGKRTFKDDSVSLENLELIHFGLSHLHD